MNRLLKIFTFLIILGFSAACSDKHELYDSMPKDIASFVTQYFPTYSIESYTSNSSGYHVRLKNGPGLTFGTNQQWLTINGYGLPLPQVLMWDQLPPALYSYLQETENTDNVFSVNRDGFRYTVELLNQTLYYDISSHVITESPTDSAQGNRGYWRE